MIKKQIREIVDLNNHLLEELEKDLKNMKYGTNYKIGYYQGLISSTMRKLEELSK